MNTMESLFKCCILYFFAMYGISKAEEVLGSQLLSSDSKARIQATERLQDLRRKVDVELIQAFESALKGPRSAVYGGSLHLTIQALGEWKVEHACSNLVNLLAWELDPGTFPRGDRFQASEFYPAAQALSRISGPECFTAILNHLRFERTSQTLVLSAWVLKEALGARLIMPFLEREIEIGSGVYSENLKKVLNILKENRPLPIPKH